MNDLGEILYRAQLKFPEHEIQDLKTGLSGTLIGKSRRDSSLKSVWDEISRPIHLDQCAFLFDEIGRFAAYIAWAKVDDEVDQRLIRSGTRTPISNHEWAAGRNVWITNFIVARGSANATLARMRDTFFAAEAEIKYMRQRRHGWMIKKIIRNRRNSFFKAGCRGMSEASEELHEHVLLERQAGFERNITLGACLRLAASTARYQNTKSADLLRRLELCEYRGQLKTYEDRDGRINGFITWAWFSMRTIERLATREISLDEIHHSEWNEGDQLCFLDMAGGEIRHQGVSRDLEYDLFPDEAGYFIYCTTKSLDDSSIREFSRDRETSFSVGA
ncbi:MAG TPA: toxin-activating lysine-acyltransferase [Burkholderiaceae bacterium]|jgi:hemolysin-activating ACP:hemolysin acyltransferase